jgi:NAD/NADP transhydrogenase alpha subunit
MPIAMELIPRTTQAQAMDALSSQATAAGYQAALLAATRLPRFLPMLMTAAGTVPPARVLVIGAGVAGLQAIATARRLGAVVSGYDIRPAAAEQVQSLGATFVGGPVEAAAEAAGGYAAAVDDETRRRQAAALAEHVAAADIVITTAQVPGKPAPLLVTREMVESMRPGSVVIDLAASTGGNCAATVPDEEVEVEGVLVLGPRDLAVGTAGHASEMYSRNVTALIQHLELRRPAGHRLRRPDHRRGVRHPCRGDRPRAAGRALGGLVMLDPVVLGVVTFVLASFIGFEVISKVPSTLHTPLMSGSNAISGITLVGALLATGGGPVAWPPRWPSSR